MQNIDTLKKKNDYFLLLDQLRKRMISMDFEGISVGNESQFWTLKL